MLSYLHRAGGVVTDYGGITSHVAIVLRNEGSHIVGTGNGTRKLRKAQL